MVLAFVVQMAFAAACPGSPPTGIDCVNPAATKSITAFSTCASVTNNHASGSPLMVPIKTSAEWLAFRTKAPAGVKVCPCGTQTIVLTTSGTWTVPACWNNSNNKFEAIGGGGHAFVTATSSSHNAGGGGAYAAVTNQTYAPGATLTYVIGAAGSGTSNGGDTSISTFLVAAGGRRGLSISPGQGGATASCTGSVKFAGGNGGTSGSAGGGGGGAAAGPNGAGGKGGNGGTGGSGGGGGANGGAVGVVGGAGTDGTGGANRLGSGAGAVGGAGSNGGGGGGGISTGGAGSQDAIWTDSTSGLSYGPAGGGGGSQNNAGNSVGYGGGGAAGATAGGLPTPGILVITYTP